MYISIVTYIDTCVLHNSVAFLIKADDVTDLDIIRIDFLTIVRLAGGTMRQIDTIVCIKAILNQTGTVEYVGAGFAIFVIASDKTSYISSETGITVIIIVVVIIIRRCRLGFRFFVKRKTCLYIEA